MTMYACAERGRYHGTKLAQCIRPPVNFCHSSTLEGVGGGGGGGALMVLYGTQMPRAEILISLSSHRVQLRCSSALLSVLLWPAELVPAGAA